MHQIKSVIEGEQDGEIFTFTFDINSGKNGDDDEIWFTVTGINNILSFSMNEKSIHLDCTRYWCDPVSAVVQIITQLYLFWHRFLSEIVHTEHFRVLRQDRYFLGWNTNEMLESFNLSQRDIWFWWPNLILRSG